MVKMYDIKKDKMVDVTQEYFDELENRMRKLALDYKKNNPDKYKEFYDNYVYTGKVNANV